MTRKMLVLLQYFSFYHHRKVDGSQIFYAVVVVPVSGLVALEVKKILSIEDPIALLCHCC